jgi:hypothetical protein
VHFSLSFTPYTGLVNLKDDRVPESLKQPLNLSTLTTWHLQAGILLAGLLFALSSHAQERRILCNEGLGSFSTEFKSGVTVKVGASKRNGTFASRTCDATFSWGKNEIPVVRGALQVDIDVLGADLGFGVPVIAFQVRDSSTEVGMTYKVFSLVGGPKLLQTITGGNYYNAQDVKLEDRNEIWTDDAAVIDGFEGVPFSSYDFAPMVVLRFEKRRLIDVSFEYQTHFDRQIAQVKAQLGAQALSEFKQSDGKLLSNSHLPMRDLFGLQATKVKVLEIVCAYLYSGRKEEAYRFLSEMWPPADLDRIRASLDDMRRSGILRQVDVEARPGVRAPWKSHAVIFDMVTVSRRTIDDASNIMSVAENASGASAGRSGGTQTTVDVAPQFIYLGLTVRKNNSNAVPEAMVYLNLVIDSAGKVRSAKLDKGVSTGAAVAAEITAASTWNFIPAFKMGHAVACQMRLGVSLQQ